MVNKQKNYHLPKKQRNSSAPSGAKHHLVRICFAVLTIVLSLASMVAPASAFLVSETDKETHTLMKGTAKYYIANESDEVESEYFAEIELGGNVPYMDSASVNDQLAYIKYWPQLNDSWSWESEVFLARRSMSVHTDRGQLTMLNYRYNVYPYLTQNGIRENAQYNHIRYDFDGFFMRHADGDFANKLVTLYGGASLYYRVYISIWHLDETNTLVRKEFQYTDNSSLIGASPSNIKAGYLLRDDVQAYINSVGANADGIYIDDLVVDVYTNGTSTLHGFTLQMLAEYKGQFTGTGTPGFIYWDDSYEDSWNAYLKRDADMPIVEGIGEMWATWLSQVTGGFLDAEIIPGISFGLILGSIVFVCIIIAFLKVFAGG